MKCLKIPTFVDLVKVLNFSKLEFATNLNGSFDTCIEVTSIVYKKNVRIRSIIHDSLSRK